MTPYNLIQTISVLFFTKSNPKIIKIKEDNHNEKIKKPILSVSTTDMGI